MFNSEQKSYGKYWFTPYGYTKTRIPNYTEVNSKAQTGAQALMKVYSELYTRLFLCFRN